jgi:hypothetical protein
MPDRQGFPAKGLLANRPKMTKSFFPILLIMTSGAILIFVGVVLIILQIISEQNNVNLWTSNMSSLAAGQLHVTTSYVGMELVVIGAALVH